jgi:hypothetical protein
VSRFVAAIPTFGRHPLLALTVRRLLRQGVFPVCVGEPEDRAVCEAEGAEFHVFPNSPLGAKWQFAFERAKDHDPQAVLYVGSSDWVSDKWCEKLYTEAKQAKAGMVGKKDIYFFDVPEKGHIQGCYWPGYAADSPRREEAMGAGRLLTRECLEAMDWRVFNRKLESSLDYSMLCNVLGAGQKAVNYNGVHAVAASISTFKWSNKHNFKKTCVMPNVVKVEREHVDFQLNLNFKELFTLFKQE